MWSSDAPHTGAPWPAGSVTEGVSELQDDPSNNTRGEATTSPEWLVRLDLAATLLMTLNTLTLMLAMGAATCWKEFWEHLKRPWACLLGMACQFAVLPALGFSLCLAFHLPPYEALSVLILACSPGGAFSNFFTYWVDGDLALSIIMTALSSLLAFGAMPLNVWLYSRRWTHAELQVPFLNILVSLAIVTAPVVVGMMVRHFSRRWATHLAKVCSVLGWAGAITCGVLLILRHWDVIVMSSVYLVITAALTPLAGFLAAYILAKTLCFSHKTCRTMAIETGCQNMVVATSIILLSFTEPQVRGRMVLFPVLYGLCQLAEVLVATGLFQAWVFAHRHDVTEEEVTSVVDTSVLTSVPVPAHKLAQAGLGHMADYATVPDACSGLEPPTHHLHTAGWGQQPGRGERRGGEEMQAFLAGPADSHAPETPWHHWMTPGTPPTTPCSPLPHRHNSTSDYPAEDSTDLDPCSDTVLESAREYDSDAPCSPALSNKGVPNMFPVTESDFPSDGEDSPLPYGSPLPSFRGRPLDPVAVGRQGAATSSLASASPTSPRSPETDAAPPFTFYHGNVCLGQTRQFSTFGRK